ncbi:MAG: hypothetical protein Kow002_10640 [Anaerolineales bacterium]
MTFVLTLHSILRWAIMVVGLVAIVKFLIGWARKSEFGKSDRGLSAGFSGLMDTQVLLGFIYFFVTGFGDAGFPMYRIEHMTTMLIAAVAAHAPAMFKKKASNKFAVAFWAIIGALILVVLGVYRLPGGWTR